MALRLVITDAVDTLGHLLAVPVTATNEPERHQVHTLAAWPDQAPALFPSPCVRLRHIPHPAVPTLRWGRPGAICR